MIELEKDKFLKINENCFLCHCHKWGEDDYFYMVAIKSDSEADLDWGLTIYGWGRNSDEAMIMALDQVVACSLRSMPLSSADISFNEFVEKFQNQQGSIERPDKEFCIDKNLVTEGMVEDQPFRVWIDVEKEECGALMV